MNGEVRRATANDAESLRLLETEARSTLIDARGGPQLLAEQPAVAAWETTTNDSSTAVWVATIDDVVVGYLELGLPDLGGTGVVRQVYVTEGARELGFGDDLLEAAMTATRAAGGAAIESWALPGDRDTKNLFERAGVTARKLIVSKRLD